MQSDENLKKLVEKAKSKNKDYRKEYLDQITDEYKVVSPKRRIIQNRKCSNCTCTSADVCSNGQSKDDEIKEKQIKSSCGRCYLGDAFRCSGCPYFGLPAFEEGEEVLFNEDDINDII